jgi:hypothetical protein
VDVVRFNWDFGQQLFVKTNAAFHAGGCAKQPVVKSLASAQSPPSRIKS